MSSRISTERRLEFSVLDANSRICQFWVNAEGRLESSVLVLDFTILCLFESLQYNSIVESVMNIGRRPVQTFCVVLRFHNMAVWRNLEETQRTVSIVSAQQLELLYPNFLVKMRGGTSLSTADCTRVT